MNKYLEAAQDKLLTPYNLTLADIDILIESAMQPAIDYVDFYFELAHAESWVLEDGIIKTGNFGIDKGVGIRALSGEKTGFAFCDDINLKNIQEAIGAAQTIAKSTSTKITYNKSAFSAQKKSLRTADFPQIYTSDNPLLSLETAGKIKLLQDIDTYLRKKDSRIIQVIASLNGAYKVVFIAANDGARVADIRPQVRLNISVIVEDSNKRECGSAAAGKRATYKLFTEEDNLPHKCADAALHAALTNLHAKPIAAGRMPVVLGSGWPAVLIHEAVGHGLEGDSIRRGSSKFAGKFGEQVASPLCSIVDQGNLSDSRGSLNIDDEGTMTQLTNLIENGKLCGCLQDKLNARLMNMQSTGNARRESYAHLPIPRMTNTYMLPGKSTPEEIIASVDKGIYAVNFSGGQVDVTSGEFVFSMNEAYMIEKGKVTYPVKGATLIGNGIEVLKDITMVGNDLAFDEGVGVCGKEGQAAAVSVGQPTLKITELTVGGQN